MKRAHYILGSILVLQVLLLIMIRAPFSAANAGSESRALLPALESITPSRLEIHQGDGKSVELMKEGDDWQLASADGYPVDAGKVSDLLDDLKSLEVRRPVVSSSRYHAALKVTDDDHERRIRIWEGASGDPDAEVFVGTSPNYSISHVREAGDDRVYEAMGVNAADFRPDAGSWIDKKFLEIPFEEVTGVKLTNAAGSFSLEKQDGQWVLTSGKGPAGRNLDQTKADTLVRSMASLWLADPVGRVDENAQGFEAPAATFQVTRTIGGPPEPEPEPEAEAADAVTSAGSDAASGEADSATSEADVSSGDSEAAASPPPEIEVTSVRIGGVSDEESGKRYCSRGGFDYAVTIAKYDAEKFVDNKLEDLFEDPPAADEATAPSE